MKTTGNTKMICWLLFHAIPPPLPPLQSPDPGPLLLSPPHPPPKSSKPAPANPNASQLGADGRLLQFEKECRDRENACRYCGLKGHFVNECPTRPQNATGSGSNAPHGRATFTISTDGTVTESSS